MYQFIHIETYAREASTKTPTKAKAKASTPQERLAALGGANAPKGMDAFTQADGKGTKGKASVRDVIAEALRNDDHCNHVEAPEPPAPGSVDFAAAICYRRKTKPRVVRGFEVAALTWRKDSNRGNSYD